MTFPRPLTGASATAPWGWPQILAKPTVQVRKTPNHNLARLRRLFPGFCFLSQQLVFNSVTNCLGPRKFLHSGKLYKAKSNKELYGFLFNDFLLLTQILKPLGSSGADKVFSPKSNLQYKMYKTVSWLLGGPGRVGWGRALPGASRLSGSGVWFRGGGAVTRVPHFQHRHASSSWALLCCASQKLCFLQTEGQALHQQKDYNLLYRGGLEQWACAVGKGQRPVLWMHHLLAARWLRGSLPGRRPTLPWWGSRSSCRRAGMGKVGSRAQVPTSRTFPGPPRFLKEAWTDCAPPPPVQAVPAGSFPKLLVLPAPPRRASSVSSCHRQEGQVGGCFSKRVSAGVCSQMGALCSDSLISEGRTMCVCASSPATP